MAQTDTLMVKMCTVGPFAENCYLVVDDESKEAVLFDPGAEAGRILAMIEKAGVKVTQILNTHAHIDHVCAVQEIKDKLDIQFGLHEKDLFWLEGLPKQAAMFGLGAPEVPEVDFHIEEGQTYTVGQHQCEVVFVPGHAPGHVMFVFDGFAICGDTVFRMGIGRTDLPGCDHQALLDSIREKIFTLPPNTVLYPGHGPETTVAYEKKNNPFFS